MRNLIRAELVGLSTLRGTWGVLALAVLGAVGIAVGDFSEAGTDPLNSAQEMRDTLVRDAGLVAAMVFAVFAALRTGGEYRHETIVQRALAAPRHRLIAVKLAVYGTIAAVTAAVGSVVAVPAAKAMASSKDVTFTLSTADVASMAGRVAAAAALFAMLGAAVAFITRSQPVAVMVVFGGLVVEQIVMGFMGSVGQYLPFQLLNSAVGDGALAPGTALVALTGVAAAVAAAGTVLLARRDV